MKAGHFSLNSRDLFVFETLKQELVNSSLGYVIEDFLLKPKQMRQTTLLQPSYLKMDAP